MTPRIVVTSLLAFLAMATPAQASVSKTGAHRAAEGYARHLLHTHQADEAVIRGCWKDATMLCEVDVVRFLPTDWTFTPCVLMVTRAGTVLERSQRECLAAYQQDEELIPRG